MKRCCQSLVVLSQTNIRSKSKEKGKGRVCGKYLNKEYNKEFTIIYCKRYVSMIENHNSGYLYNELLAKVMKKNVRSFKEQLGHLFFILLSKHFLSGFSVCILYFLFHKGKDTSAVPQPSGQYLVYVFINALITSQNKKQKHRYKFSHWNMCFFIALPP